MLTQGEAHALYVELLDKLRGLRSDALAREIELTVLRGALRTEQGATAKGLVYQTPLSPKEALLLGLRMFLAALEPALQIAHARGVLTAPADGGEGDEEEAVSIAWAFDRLQPAEDDRRSQFPQADPETLGELEGLPSTAPGGLVSLREAAEHLASLVHELEGEEA